MDLRHILRKRYANRHRRDRLLTDSSSGINGQLQVLGGRHGSVGQWRLSPARIRRCSWLRRLRRCSLLRRCRFERRRKGFRCGAGLFWYLTRCRYRLETAEQRTARGENADVTEPEAHSLGGHRAPHLSGPPNIPGFTSSHRAKARAAPAGNPESVRRYPARATAQGCRYGGTEPPDAACRADHRSR